MFNELLLGCGHRRMKLLFNEGHSEWANRTTLDINPDCKPDVLHDLNELPYPFEDASFDEIHAYEVLEHCGRQGDAKFFFAQFDEFYRMLRPNGAIFGSVPDVSSRWAWGDPSHTRVLQPETFAFLNREFYKYLGSTPSSDFRRMFKSDFRLVHQEIKDGTFWFILNKVG